MIECGDCVECESLTEMKMTLEADVWGNERKQIGNLTCSSVESARA